MKRRTFCKCEECGGLGAFEVKYVENGIEYMELLPCAKCDGWKMWWKNEKPKKFWTREEILKNPKLKLKDPFGRNWEWTKEVAERQKKEEREVKTESEKEEKEKWGDKKKACKKQGQTRKDEPAKQEWWTPKDWLDPVQSDVLIALAGAKVPQIGEEICVTLKKICKRVKSRRKGAKHISKPTAIKTLNELCEMNFISKKVYVLSKGRGKISKIATYTFLPKGVMYLAGLFGKFGEKVKRMYNRMWDRIVERWKKEKAKELDRIGKVGINVKNWLIKQGYRLLKCTHPYLVGDG